MAKVRAPLFDAPSPAPRLSLTPLTCTLRPLPSSLSSPASTRLPTRVPSPRLWSSSARERERERGLWTSVFKSSCCDQSSTMLQTLGCRTHSRRTPRVDLPHHHHQRPHHHQTQHLQPVGWTHLCHLRGQPSLSCHQHHRGPLHPTASLWLRLVLKPQTAADCCGPGEQSGARLRWCPSRMCSPCTCACHHHVGVSNSRGCSASSAATDRYL